LSKNEPRVLIKLFYKKCNPLTVYLSFAQLLKVCFSVNNRCTEEHWGPYYGSKLELKSNSSEILPVNCNKFTCGSTSS